MKKIYKDYAGELKSCPLCGKPVVMKLMARAEESEFASEMFAVRAAIKCECYLTLDVFQNGISDGAELEAVLDDFGEKIAEKWNGRADHV